MNGHFDFSDFCQFVDSIYSRIQIRIEKLGARIQQHSRIDIKLTHVKNLAVDFILTKSYLTLKSSLIIHIKACHPDQNTTQDYFSQIS